MRTVDGAARHRFFASFGLFVGACRSAMPTELEAPNMALQSALEPSAIDIKA